ncbi:MULTISPECIES: DUF4230 domain-containing protein [Trichocoleus]|uniref:DUF4230 domain-containing protein n=1 Tax=Trichocoleus desertorum GB2-A4 TaxID=2933944 RepID=A0ABV0J9K9_9CYAN|nr:DUF4230 domain-containing protein [Trichocoleus sp. FACHB-46]MBD1862812.1 DUF4230 domain-containing protein [Trichocoleus sp. FACHB-46]
MRDAHPQQSPTHKNGFLYQLIWMSTGAIALMALIMLLGVWRSGQQFWLDLQALWRPTETAPQVDVRSVALRQIQGVSELSTTVFAMEAIVPTHQNRELAGFVVGTTKLLYIAYGEVRAGVDLGQLQPQDVVINGDIIQIRLPPPRILDAKIDVTRSQVYDYDRGLLGLGPDVAPNLQTLAEQQALKKIVATACQEGVLQKASDRAQQVVSQLLRTTGYSQVVVTTQPPLPAACAAT